MSTALATVKERYRFLDQRGEHLHTLNNEPLYGISTVMSVIAKPLTWWASGLAVKEFGVPDPKVLTKLKNKKATTDEIKTLYDALELRFNEIKGMDLETFLALVQKAYRAHQTTLAERADVGIDLHAEHERFINDQISGQLPLVPYPDQIQPFITWAKENVKEYLWSEVHGYSKEHWIGGISDLGFIHRDGSLWIMDFKSSKEAYLTQFWQCGGYALALMENGGFDAEGNQLFPPIKQPDFFGILPYGMPNPYPAINVDTKACMENFLHTLAIHKAMPKQ